MPLNTTQLACVLNFAVAFQYIRRYDALVFYGALLSWAFISNTVGPLGGALHLFVALALALAICTCTNLLRGRLRSTLPLYIYDMRTLALTRLVRIAILLVGVLAATLLRFDAKISTDDKAVHVIDSISMLTSLWMVLFIAYWCDAQSHPRRGRIVYDDDSALTHAYFAGVCGVFVLTNLLFVMHSPGERLALVAAIGILALTRLTLVRAAITHVHTILVRKRASNKND